MRVISPDICNFKALQLEKSVKYCIKKKKRTHSSSRESKPHFRNLKIDQLIVQFLRVEQKVKKINFMLCSKSTVYVATATFCANVQLCFEECKEDLHEERKIPIEIYI